MSCGGTYDHINFPTTFFVTPAIRWLKKVWIASFTRSLLLAQVLYHSGIRLNGVVHASFDCRMGRMLRGAASHLEVRSDT